MTQESPAGTIIDIDSSRLSQSGLGWVARINLVLCGILILALVGLISFEVVGRSFLNRSFDGTEEFAGYFLVAIIFLSMPICLRDGSLLRVDFIIERFSAWTQHRLQLVFDILSTVFTSVLLWQLIRLTLSTYNRGMVSSTSMQTPLWIPQLIMPIGAAMLLIALLERVYVRGRLMAKGEV